MVQLETDTKKKKKKEWDRREEIRMNHESVEAIKVVAQ